MRLEETLPYIRMIVGHINIIIHEAKAKKSYQTNKQKKPRINACFITQNKKKKKKKRETFSTNSTCFLKVTLIKLKHI